MQNQLNKIVASQHHDQKDCSRRNITSKDDTMILPSLKIVPKEQLVKPRLQPMTSKTNVVTTDNPNVGSVKSIISLLKEINDEYITLSELIVDTGFTGVEDNFRLREKLNDIIYQIRKTQNFVIKVKNKNKKSEQ